MRYFLQQYVLTSLVLSRVNPWLSGMVTCVGVLVSTLATANLKDGFGFVLFFSPLNLR